MKVAIIGNGDLEFDFASVIDSCDFVIRLNMVRGFSGHYGEKLDCLGLCNTGVAAVKVMDPKQNAFIARGPRIVLARNPALYTDIGTQFLGQRAAEFFVDFSHLATKPGFKHARVRCVDYEIGLSLMTKLPTYSPEPFIMPSTGIRIVEEVLQHPTTFDFAVPVSMVYVAGFGHTGWPGHPWAAERALIDAYQAAGLLTRLG